MLKTAIYCRVSTDDQEKEGTSLQTQLESCLKYCEEKGYQVVHKFSETYSGLTLERPKLNKLRDLVNTYNLDNIVIYCLDRLSRDPSHGAILFQQLEDHHVSLEAVTETIENTDMGKLINYIRGFASKLEAEKIRERTMRGKLARLKEGKLPQGTGIGIYGYQWDKTSGKRQIIDHEAQVIKDIFVMVLQGFSFHKMALELNSKSIRTKSGSMWYPLTIKRIVTNPSYTGKTYFGRTKRISNTKVTSTPQEDWILLPDITPPIISEEMFNRAQAVLLQSKQSRPIKQNSPYLLTGFLKCSKCGSTIGGTTLSGKYRYYHCRGARPTTTRGKFCDAGYIRADDLEKSVWKQFLEFMSSPLTLITFLTEIETAKSKRFKKGEVLSILEKQITQLRKKLKTYPIKEKKLYSILPDESVTKDYVLDEVNKLKQNRLHDEQELSVLLAERKKMTTSKEVTLRLSELSDLYRTEALQSQQINLEDGDELKKIRNILEFLQLKVVADPQSYQFSFKLGAQLVSSTDSDSDACFAQQLKEFEHKHPDISIEDLLSDKPLPEDTPYGRLHNQIKKNLVTIEQTSA